MVAGELAFAIWHESRLLRAHFAYKVHQVVKWIAFNIEFTIGPSLE